MEQNAPTKEPLAADAFEMAQEVDDADEAAARRSAARQRKTVLVIMLDLLQK